MQQLSMNDLMTEKKEEITINPSFYSNSYWKLEDEQSIDDLLVDYQ